MTTRAAQFGAQLRFFRQLCTAAKVPHIIALTRRALAEGHCVVIGLQSTGARSSPEWPRTHDGTRFHGVSFVSKNDHFGQS